MKNNHIFLDRTELLLEVSVENNVIVFKTNDFRGFPYADFHFVFDIKTLNALASSLLARRHCLNLLFDSGGEELRQVFVVLEFVFC